MNTNTHFIWEVCKNGLTNKPQEQVSPASIENEELEVVRLFY